jgi:hypothetical protein
LCEGTNHVLVECHLNAVVDEVNQQVMQKLHNSLGKAGAEFEPKEVKYFDTTKRNNPRGRLQVTKNNRKKRERFSTIIMEYEKQELEDLLALEKPRKKKGISQVDVGWPSDTSASRPPSPPPGPMTRARAKALHDKVNLFLNTLDLEHTWNGSLPHGNIICAVRYEPHGETTKEEEHEEEA